ncbi:MAG: hypothetical protein A2900_03585 [Candidatus Chisholmbacteria bacterium RIFCSPLOWO2_01_FULL_50_28]|uniref:Glycosyl transferase family 1 domain-containing protein n=1 Tax=Candidatus Chisholmbacteria bacterium RIFCSPHIGHO2_01_FULL_52_32 TaxID=1797591 RepID=A0A1G1VST8_9BACT|nr:MAG: hypothetical protein A2786_03160 [Candidatus Chisholmbacteria bacterium RIFCSPHIGHO2_01_FULL_52_32]OGY20158.1 MAG: hypothetical protein A2900_03585 [Candidatus Chisholmbacteria bacterium RIFCSPLOWO2_01_FULL_50_28]
MKIAIDVTATIYEGSGVGTYYRNLVPKLLLYGKEHTFIPFGYSLRSFGKLTMAKKKLPFPPKLMELLWNMLHILPVETLTGSCDIVHTWDYIQPPTKKAKIVTTIHDLTPLKFPKQHLPATRAAYKAGLRWVKKEAAAVIADSVATKQDIVEILNIPEKKVVVVYLAAPPEFSEFRKAMENTRNTTVREVKEKYGIQKEYLLSVGTHEPRKNIQRTIEAYSILQLDQELVIAGRFGWGEKITPVPGVKPIGFVENKDLPALYAGASLFLYPSLYEGFGLPVLEAMAVGCPVLTSDRGSLAEIAGSAAATVNPESAEAIAFGIRVALERSEELRAKGIAQAEKFSWDETARQTLKVYEGILGGKVEMRIAERA